MTAEDRVLLSLSLDFRVLSFHLAGLDNQTIARLLTVEGFKTKHGLPVTVRWVDRQVSRLRKRIEREERRCERL